MQTKMVHFGPHVLPEIKMFNLHSQRHLQFFILWVVKVVINSVAICMLECKVYLFMVFTGTFFVRLLCIWFSFQGISIQFRLTGGDNGGNGKTPFMGKFAYKWV